MDNAQYNMELSAQMQNYKQQKYFVILLPIKNLKLH